MVRFFARVMLLAGFAMLLQACIVIPIQFPGSAEVRQVVYREGSGIKPPKVAIVDVSGVLTTGGSGDGFFRSDSPVVDLTKKLHAIKGDKRIKAVILRMDSPGGGVTASDIMYHELMEFRRESGIPVYVSMQTVAASGGYYVSMAADKVYATPTSLTGSIGVIGVFPDLTGLMRIVGVDMHAVKSGDMKDAGAFYRGLGDDERAVYQSIIDQFHNQFVAVIARNRTRLDEATVRSLADGRVYTAQQAHEAGLVDGVAYLDEVIGIVENDLGVQQKKATVVLIARSGKAKTESLYAAGQTPAAPEAKSGGTQVNLLNIDARSLLDPVGEPFNYLWIP
ncbi:MAG: signal peptide peptidase SppA [Candidatus Sumerlaeia bacterium]|nr:signal peptide peptidase SppA [Candidatus Sumerlaeia bacterium]